MALSFVHRDDSGDHDRNAELFQPQAGDAVDGADQSGPGGARRHQLGEEVDEVELSAAQVDLM